MLIVEDMLDAGPDLRAPMVGGLLPLVQPAPAVALLVNPALVAQRPQLFLACLGPVGRIGPNGTVRILFVEEVVEDLAVMHPCGGLLARMVGSLPVCRLLA